jgi:hypothetical protein
MIPYGLKQNVLRVHFFLMFILTKRREYSADTSLPERRQEKNMVKWG